jgi:hypothetical protein
MISVVDGDTIDVSIDGHRERVRLIGIDTPETKKPNTPVECFGPEATTFTQSMLVEDALLHLERDVVRRLRTHVGVCVLATDGTLSTWPRRRLRLRAIRPNAAAAEFRGRWCCAGRQHRAGAGPG